MDNHNEPSEEVLKEWVLLAVRIRALQSALDRLAQCEVGGTTADDDEEFPSEKLSDWAIFYMSSAVEHLGQWVELCIPSHTVPALGAGPISLRPLMTLGRGGLESACAAFWVLDEDATPSRLNRHVQLVIGDLQAEAKVSSEEARGYLKALEDDYREFQSRTGGSTGRVSCTDMILGVAKAMGRENSGFLTAWQHASAAAHGKRWLTFYDDPAPDGYRIGTIPSNDDHLHGLTCLVTFATDILYAAMTLYVETSEIDGGLLLFEATLESLKVLTASPGHRAVKLARALEVVLDLRTSYARLFGQNPPELVAPMA